MREKIAAALKNAFWLSLLLHVLLLLSFSLVYTGRPPIAEPKPSLDIPAYVYNDFPSPPPKIAQQKEDTSTLGTMKPVTKQVAETKPRPPAKPEQKTEAIHLVGDDKKTPPKPLAKLIGKGLAAHLVYPKIATDFNLKGTAFIGFILYPNGQVREAQVVQSSGSDILDNAALAGVQAISPLKDVDLYLQEPKFLVVGIIFSGNEPVGRLMI